MEIKTYEIVIDESEETGVCNILLTDNPIVPFIIIENGNKST